MEECSTDQAQGVLSRLQKVLETDFYPLFDSSLSPVAQQDSISGYSPTAAAPTSTSKSPKCIRRVVSSAKFEKETIQRMLQFQRKKEERIKQVAEARERQAVSELRPPEINRSFGAGKHVPIFERVDDILKKKDEWLRQQAEVQKAKQDALESSLPFHPQISAHPRVRRTAAEFEANLESAKDKHDKELQRLRDDSERKQRESLKFHPTISKKSQELTKERGNLMDRMEDEAIMSALRKKDTEAKYTPSFRPELTLKSQELAAKRTNTQSVFDRLYRTPDSQLIT